MKNEIFLCDAKVNDTFKIIDLRADAKLNTRLKDLGFIPGTVCRCVLKSPLGDPLAFSVRGTMIALRRDDSRFIKVEVL